MFPFKPGQEDPPVDSLSYGITRRDSMPMPIRNPEPCLSAAERANLLDDGVPLNDPHVRLVTADDGGYGFDVDGVDGPAKVRFDATVITIEGTWTADGRVDVSDGGSINPDNWKPWFIPSGPASVVGTRYDGPGEAVRAALRGSSDPLTDLWRYSR